MEQAQNQLDFKIETPNDKELERRFRSSSVEKSTPSRNQRKRKRQAARKARRVTA